MNFAFVFRCSPACGWALRFQTADVTLRPNQVFAISLPHPVLERRHWENVMSILLIFREEMSYPQG